MTETMGIESYLEQGGVLTSPTNAPARYRGELMRIMASFVDSELAGSAGFANVINDAQGIKERIAMDIERYGDVKVVSIVSDRGREEQLRMKGAKL